MMNNVVQGGGTAEKMIIGRVHKDKVKWTMKRWELGRFEGREKKRKKRNDKN